MKIKLERLKKLVSDLVMIIKLELYITFFSFLFLNTLGYSQIFIEGRINSKNKLCITVENKSNDSIFLYNIGNYDFIKTTKFPLFSRNRLSSNSLEYQESCLQFEFHEPNNNMAPVNNCNIKYDTLIIYKKGIPNIEFLRFDSCVQYSTQMISQYPMICISPYGNYIFCINLNKKYPKNEVKISLKYWGYKNNFKNVRSYIVNN